MTDVATVLPSEIRLGAPPTMPQARSYMFRQQSTLQSYSSGNQIQINIPRLQRSYLRKDSYLRFGVDIIEQGSASTQVGTGATGNPVGTMNPKQTLTFDSAGGFGLIQKIEVFDYLGSTVLESISEVPQLMALLLDLGLPEIDSSTNGQAMMGLENGCVSNDTLGFQSGATAGSGTAATWNSSSKMRVPQCGRTLGYYASNNTALPVNGLPIYSLAYSTEIAIPLPSFLGFLSKKMVPLHNGFTILITLVSKPEVAFFHAGADAYPSISVASAATSATALNPAPTTIPTATTLSYTMTVNEVYMDCQILELGPVAESMILSSTGGQPLVVHTKSFRSYVGQVSAKASEFILNLNLNVASLTNILWMMRSKDQLDKQNHQSIGNRTRNMLQRWFFQYGSTSLPQNNGIQTLGISYPSYASTSSLKYITAESRCTEGLMELLKSRSSDIGKARITQENYSWDYKWGAILSTDATMGPIVNAASWHFAGPACPLPIGKFAGGLNLELANDKPELISGINTNGMNTSIRGIFHPLFTDQMDNVRVDAYAEYDAFINVSPGIATTVSF